MLHRLIIGFAALLIASPALAEVADKEPSVGALWAWALGFNVIALLLEAVRPVWGYSWFPSQLYSHGPGTWSFPTPT